MTRKPLILLAAAATLTGCAAQTAAVAPPSAVSGPASARALGLDDPAPDSMRWLYGSGEAAGASIQAWRMLADYAVAVSRQRKVPQSVPMGLPDAPGGVGTPSCQRADGTQKPFAVVLDVDETVVLNAGYEYWLGQGNSYNETVWNDWADNGAPHVAPVPGAVTGLRRLREAGIAVIYNTNRDKSTAAGTIAAIKAAGAGPARHGDTLFMIGDDAMGSRKDGRRALIAQRYCVIALGGDNLGDFADVFNTSGLAPQDRRAKAGRGELAQLWGNGWFALPNPVYGASIRGTMGEVFPPEWRWQPRTATTNEDK